jgi:hypothetical protein
MYHQLLSSQDQIALDRNAKPNPATRLAEAWPCSRNASVVFLKSLLLVWTGAGRDKLAELVKRAPTEMLQMEDRNLLWRFRYYLTRDKKAMTKVMRSLDWGDAVRRRPWLRCSLPPTRPLPGSRQRVCRKPPLTVNA